MKVGENLNCIVKDEEGLCAALLLEEFQDKELLVIEYTKHFETVFKTSVIGNFISVNMVRSTPEKRYTAENIYSFTDEEQ
jgi:hypothetical protein